MYATYCLRADELNEGLVQTLKNTYQQREIIILSKEDYDEHWTKIGRMAEENPDLPYEFIKNILEAKAEMENGEVSPFEFRYE